MTPLYAAAFPNCWKKPSKICNDNWISAVEYLEIIGIIVGQCLVGVLGDWYILIIPEIFAILTELQAWSTLGSYSRCHHHVHGSAHAYCVVGCYSERMGHLLCLVTLLLRCWCRRRISDDCHIWYGECCWLRQDFDQGRPSSPWMQGHECVLDAGLGSIGQPSRAHYPSSRLPPR